MPFDDGGRHIRWVTINNYSRSCYASRLQSLCQCQTLTTQTTGMESIFPVEIWHIIFSLACTDDASMMALLVDHYLWFQHIFATSQRLSSTGLWLLLTGHKSSPFPSFFASFQLLIRNSIPFCSSPLSLLGCRWLSKSINEKR